MANPSVSVVLPAYNSQTTVAACLQSLRAQTFRDFETILVDSSPTSETESLVQRQFPEVRLQRSTRRLWPHAARNLGATLALGGIFVFSDPDCVMAPGWLERLMAAHNTGHPLTGGAVDSLHRDWFSLGVHLCKYGWWLSGGSAGVLPELPSANVSYTRDLFARIGPFPEEWCGDTLLSQRGASAGAEPWFEPAAQILHDHLTTWPQFLQERFQRGYDYGLVRPRLERWSRARSFVYAAAAPVIVVVMLARAAGHALASGRLLLLARCLPVVAMGFAARAYGEAKAHWRMAWRQS